MSNEFKIFTVYASLGIGIAGCLASTYALLFTDLHFLGIIMGVLGMASAFMSQSLAIQIQADDQAERLKQFKGE